LVRKFNELLEDEIKKIYKFFVTQERELYLQINARLHVRKRYLNFSLAQVSKELDELISLSIYAMSISCFVYYNITAIAKILKKFDKKFKRYDLDFQRKFIVEKYQKKNSDLLYIHQYKILDEVGACVEQLKNELYEQYIFLVKNPIKELNNQRTSILYEQIKKEEGVNNSEKGLPNNDNSIKEELIQKDDEDLNFDDKFSELINSIESMEAFYKSTSRTFNIWVRFIKSNDYKSHIYSVKSAGEIEDHKSEDSIISSEGSEKSNKLEHYLSKESYWNIRLILVQAFFMSMCSTYIYPIIYYLLISQGDKETISEDDISRNIRKGFLSGLVISMSPLGGLFSMPYSYCIIKKNYKIAMISSSILSIIGNILFILGIVKISFPLVIIGRLTTGFSENTPVHRQYLLYFIPKRKIDKYLLYFKIIVLVGNSCGPFLSFLCLLFYKNPFEDFNLLIINAYSLPGWICFLFSLILLIFILALFTNPLNPTFRVYAEGLSPSETIKNHDSFALDDSLTLYESEKLNEINKKVSDFNDENQFSDTNLVSSTIKELIEKEIGPHGTVRKAFWVIMIYIFILNFTIMCYISMCPSYLFINLLSKEESITRTPIIISFLYFISLLLIIPSFIFNFFYISIRTNKILYIKILALFLFLVETITTCLLMQNFLYLYFVSFLLSVICAFIMEDQLIFLYTKIIPSNFELLGIKGLTLLHIIKYLGNIIGGISSLFGFIMNKEEVEDDEISEKYGEGLMISQNAFAILVQFIMLVLFFCFTNKFSNRPIRRIVYSKNTREIKRNEF